MRVSEPLTNTGTAPSCRSANFHLNLARQIDAYIDLEQC
jgi:hypothetical protein